MAKKIPKRNKNLTVDEGNPMWTYLARLSLPTTRPFNPDCNFTQYRPKGADYRIRITPEIFHKYFEPYIPAQYIRHCDADNTDWFVISYTPKDGGLTPDEYLTYANLIIVVDPRIKHCMINLLVKPEVRDIVQVRRTGDPYGRAMVFTDVYAKSRVPDAAHQIQKYFPT